MPHVPFESVNLRSVSLAEDSLILEPWQRDDIRNEALDENYWPPMLYGRMILYTVFG